MIDAHRGAFEYDWRTRFHLPLDAVGNAMPFGEAIRMVQILAADPGSQIGATLSKWEHPVSRESLVLMDLYDLQHASKAGRKRPRPYPRPWTDRDVRRRGNAAGRTPEQIRDILNAHGHSLN